MSPDITHWAKSSPVEKPWLRSTRIYCLGWVYCGPEQTGFLLAEKGEGSVVSQGPYWNWACSLSPGLAKLYFSFPMPCNRLGGRDYPHFTHTGTEAWRGSRALLGLTQPPHGRAGPQCKPAGGGTCTPTAGWEACDVTPHPSGSACTWQHDTHSLLGKAPQAARTSVCWVCHPGISTCLSSYPWNQFCWPRRTSAWDLYQEKYFGFSCVVDHRLSLSGMEPGSHLEEVRARNL